MSSFFSKFKFGQKKDELDLETIYNDALKLLKNKDLEQAKNKFEEILRSEPNNNGSLVNLSKIYIYENKFEQAIDLLKRYLIENPNSFEGKIKLSQAHLKNNDSESAIGILNQLRNSSLEENELEKVNENIVKVYIYQIELFRKEKKYKEAIYTYEDIYKINNDKDFYLFNLAKTYLDSKNSHKAIEYFNQLIENKKTDKKYLIDSYYNLGKIEENESRDYRAMKIYQEIIEKKIDNTYKAYFNAKISFFNKNYQESIEYFKQSITNKVFLSDSYLGIAQSYYNEKKYNKSLDFYQKSFELNKNYKTLLLIIINLLRMSIYDKALEHLNKMNEKVFNKYPILAKEISLLLFDANLIDESYTKLQTIQKILIDDPEINVYIAKYYKIKGNIDLYNNEMENLILNYSHNYIVLKEIAQYFISLNQFDKAIDIYDKMLQTWVKNKEPLKLKAELFEKNKNSKEAIKILEEYVSFENNDIESIYKLGLAFFDNIQMDKATNYFEKIKSDPKYGFASSSLLSDIYISKGDTDRSIKSIQKCFEFFPNYIEGYIKYAKIFANMGQVDKAMGYLKYAQTIQPENKDISYFINYYSSMH